jgi:hypothetical protein
MKQPHLLKPKLSSSKARETAASLIMDTAGGVGYGRRGRLIHGIGGQTARYYERHGARLDATVIEDAAASAAAAM